MEKITAIMVLEILGKPPEHLKDTLKDLIKEMTKQPKVKIIKSNIAEPKPLKENPELFTSFAEIEVEADLDVFMLLLFAFMPAHVEIITPENLKISNSDLNTFLNELLRRLHQYDEIAKSILLERQFLAKQIQEGKIKIIETDKKPVKKKKKSKS